MNTVRLLQKAVLFLLLVTMICITSDALASMQVQDRTLSAEIHKASLAELQEKFYKAEIEKEISVEFEDETLKEALAYIARETGLKLTYRGDIIADKEVTLLKERINASDALAFVLDGTGLDYKFSQDGYLLIAGVDEIINEVVYQETVTGQVVDTQTGEALPGVNIIIEGTTTGTTTSVDGTYSLSVPDLEASLVYSYIGYHTEIIAIEGRTTIDVELELTVGRIDEVVVTALGIARQSRSVGYSTATVTPEQFTTNRTGNFMNSLQGQVAGVNIEGVASGPGGSSRVRIRGQSSFGSNNSPLIVVDGVPISNEGNHAAIGADGEIDGGDGLGSINPDAIESMNILRGAAAAAMYGSRAKDGVIIITTKRDAGHRGVGVTFNSNIQMAIPYDDRNIQTEYGQGEGGQRPTSSFPGSGVWSFGERIEPGMTQTLFDGQVVPYEAQPSHVDNFMRNAYTINNSINLATGGPGGGMNLSISQLHQESIVPNSDFDRNNVSLGFTQNVTSDLNVMGSINYSLEKNNNPVVMNNQVLNVPTVIYTLANTMPLDMMREYARDENGDEVFYSRFAHRTNPFFTTDPDVRVNQSERHRMYGNLAARLNLTDWLYLQTRVGQDYFTRNTEVNEPTGLAFAGPAPEGFFNGTYTENILRFREINADFLIGLQQQLSEQIGISGTLGGNMMNRRSDSNTQEGDDFVVRDLYTLGNSRLIDAEYSYTERQTNSLYASAEFDYNNYLFLNFTGRNEWFSTLDPDERSIFYPSVTSSFVFTDVIDTPGWLNQGILRAGYGEVGSDTDVAFAAGMLTYSTETNLYPGIDGSMRTIGFISGTSLPVQGLRPMRVKEFEIGIDLLLFQTMGIDLTFYDKRSVDQILSQSISTATGFETRPVNVGESLNRGVELMVNLAPVQTTDFLWNFTFNGSYNRTEVLSVGDETDNIPVGGGDWATPGGVIRHVKGNPLGEIWVTGYERDEQGRKIINQENGRPINTSEPINFGTSIPKWVGGITNTFRYKDLGFSFLIDYKLGHKLLSGLGHNLYRHGLDPRTLPGRDTGTIVVDGVTPDGGVNTVETNVYDLYQNYGSLREHFIYNAGYWKLRQVTLDINLTRHVSGFVPVQNLVFSIVGNHLLVLKKWTPQHDPEQISFIGDDNRGVSGAALPMTRNFGFNLKLEF